VSWQTVPLRKLITPNNRRNRPDLPLLSVVRDKGVIKRKLDKSDNHNIIPEDLSNYKVVSEGQFVINKMKAWQGSCGVSAFEGIVSPAYFVFDLQGADSRFFNYAIRSRHYVDEFGRISKGIRVDQWDLELSQLKYIRFPLPPRDEQDQIVRYLDWKVSQINKLINAKRRQIELLAEQKRAVVHKAVTKCGEGWQQLRIKATAKILRGKFSHRPRNDPAFYDGEYPFVQTGDVARAGKYIRKYKQTLNNKGYSVSKQFPKGTLTMTIAANIGDVAILDFDACFPDSVVGFVPHKGIDLEYLYYAFFSMKVEFIKEAPINTQGNLNVERVGTMTVSVPNEETQRNIVHELEICTMKTDKIIDKLNDELTLFAEYRTRIISDVVTGKLDVRGVAVPEYEVVEDAVRNVDDEIDTMESEE